MKKVKVLKYILVLSMLFTLLIVLIPGCSAPSKPIEVRLSFSESPTLGKPVQVTATFKIRKGYFKETLHDVNANIYLSEGFQLIEGNTLWSGDLIRGQEVTIVATIKTIQTGTWLIEASAGSEFDGAWGFKGLYVIVSEEGATISDRPPLGPTQTPYTTNPPDSQTSSINGPSLPLEVKLSFKISPK